MSLWVWIGERQDDGFEVSDHLRYFAWEILDSFYSYTFSLWMVLLKRKNWLRINRFRLYRNIDTNYSIVILCFFSFVFFLFWIRNWKVLILLVTVLVKFQILTQTFFKKRLLCCVDVDRTLPVRRTGCCHLVDSYIMIFL